MRSTALAFLFLVPLTGCPKLGGLGDIASQFLPKVSFRNLKVTSLDFSQIGTNFVFAVENPNPIKVKLASFSYDLDLAGHDLIQGNQADGLALEAQGESKLVFPVQTKFADLFSLVGDLKGKDSVPFQFAGKIGFNTPLGEVKIPFTEGGDFPVIHLPKVSFKAVKVGKIDVLKQSATLNLLLGLAHDGGRAISLDGFDYGIKFGGTRVASGLVEQLATVEGSAGQTVNLPLTVNLLNLGASIVTAITTKTKVDVGLDAKLTVGTPFGPVPLTLNEKGLVDVL